MYVVQRSVDQRVSKRSLLHIITISTCRQGYQSYMRSAIASHYPVNCLHALYEIQREDRRVQIETARAINEAILKIRAIS